MHRFDTIPAVTDKQTDMLLSQRPALRNMRRAGKNEKKSAVLGFELTSSNRLAH